MTKLIIELAQGNPGAVTCLISLFDNNQDLDTGASMFEREFILAYLSENNIKGTNLYVLWSNISDKNLSLMYHIVKTAPAKDVVNASSQQDYSGRVTLKKYIDAYHINTGE